MVHTLKYDSVGYHRGLATPEGPPISRTKAHLRKGCIRQILAEIEEGSQKVVVTELLCKMEISC